MTQNLRGLILAGGHGTRLRPLTHTSAKQLIPIANKPVLFYGIEAMRAAGIEEIAIVVGHTKAEIIAAVGDGARFGVRVAYIEQDAPRGLAHCVMIARSFLRDSPFMMYLGDNFIVDGVAEIASRFRATSPDALIVLSEVEDPRAFGVALVEGEIVTALVEKPNVPISNLAIVGVYVFGPRIFDACSGLKPSWRGELEITDAIQQLILDRRTVLAEVIRGSWKDTGVPEDLLNANRLVLTRIGGSSAGDVDAMTRVGPQVIIGESARIRRSVIPGPAIIGEGAVIEDSRLGPFTSIADNCIVRGSDIENSILLECSRILDVRTPIRDSILGKGALVESRAKTDEALAFILGDQSAARI